MSARSASRVPLIAHIVHRFDVGGLENGVVNLINGMPAERARHAVIALTETTDFAKRIESADVPVYALDKKPGQDPRAHLRLHRLLRTLQPDVVHTRNIGTIECQVVAALAGVKHRIHGEHGWDTYDPDGLNARYRALRRLVSPLIHSFVALSQEIEHWLVDSVGIRANKVVRICNGVDTQRFHACRRKLNNDDTVTIGTVTRLTDIKDPLNTLEAFIALRSQLQSDVRRVRLLVVGDGPLRGAMEQRVREAGACNDVELVHAQQDVAPWLQRFDIFVLGSHREGISNTILEAMASELPVVACRTGGNPELVEHGTTGLLVEPGCSSALCQALALYVHNDGLRASHGAAGRRRVEERFSLTGMIEAYMSLYERCVAGTAN